MCFHEEWGNSQTCTLPKNLRNSVGYLGLITVPGKDEVALKFGSKCSCAWVYFMWTVLK